MATLNCLRMPFLSAKRSIVTINLCRHTFHRPLTALRRFLPESFNPEHSCQPPEYCVTRNPSHLPNHRKQFYFSLVLISNESIRSHVATEPGQVPYDVRLPRSVQAIYLKPLRREAQYGVPSCDLQLRSYSVRNLEFFADFALRAAYYLNLPAFGPVPLPRITERWTVPKSNFIFKKSQENFERITMRRLIQVKDGHPETVEIWLAFLKKHAYYGIGMKANVWEYNKLGRFLKWFLKSS